MPYFKAGDSCGNLDGSGLLNTEREGFAIHTGFRQLPYTPQCEYSRKLSDLQLDTVVIENDRLRATFLADYGARLWSLYDKKAKRELLFSNPVFRLSNLAIRNAWFSGGIEWNLGHFGHTCLTCEPMFFAVCKGPDGEQFLRVYEYERQSCLLEQIDFHLPDGSDELFAHVKIVNSKAEKAPLYWWTNIAVKEESKLRVFSSSDLVIRLRPSPDDCHNPVKRYAHDSMPYLNGLGGIDASYPQKIPYSTEYFYQNGEDISEMWEAALYGGGTGFFERSTAPLRYRKMFCWGNHTGGKRWKDFLSVKGKGNYVEIQAGLLPTQAHGADMEPKSCLSFTQAFGGIDGFGEKAFGDWKASRKYVKGLVSDRLSEKSIEAADIHFAALENVRPQKLLHYGSGWGALELLRDPSFFPESVIFPKDSMEDRQRPWAELLKTGRLPELDGGCVPSSWMVDPQWLKILERSLENEENRNWTAYLHFGAMLFENDRRGDAVKAMQSSMEYKPTAICSRNLAVAFASEGKNDKAAIYMEKSISLCKSENLRPFAEDALRIYTKAGLFQKAWELYDSLPDTLKDDSRICMQTAWPALKMKKWDFLNAQFTREFDEIQEGDSTLTDVWYHMQAIRLAEKRNESDYTKLLAEVYSTFDPPYNIDFRMY